MECSHSEVYDDRHNRYCVKCGITNTINVNNALNFRSEYANNMHFVQNKPADLKEQVMKLINCNVTYAIPHSPMLRNMVSEITDHISDIFSISSLKGFKRKLLMRYVILLICSQYRYYEKLLGVVTDMNPTDYAKTKKLYIAYVSKGVITERYDYNDDSMYFILYYGNIFKIGIDECILCFEKLHKIKNHYKIANNTITHLLHNIILAIIYLTLNIELSTILNYISLASLIKIEQEIAKIENVKSKFDLKKRIDIHKRPKMSKSIAKNMLTMTGTCEKTLKTQGLTMTSEIMNNYSMLLPNPVKMRDQIMTMADEQERKFKPLRTYYKDVTRRSTEALEQTEHSVRPVLTKEKDIVTYMNAFFVQIQSDIENVLQQLDPKTPIEILEREDSVISLILDIIKQTERSSLLAFVLWIYNPKMYKYGMAMMDHHIRDVMSAKYAAYSVGRSIWTTISNAINQYFNVLTYRLVAYGLCELKCGQSVAIIHASNLEFVTIHAVNRSPVEKQILNGFMDLRENINKLKEQETTTTTAKSSSTSTGVKKSAAAAAPPPAVTTTDEDDNRIVTPVVKSKGVSKSGVKSSKSGVKSAATVVVADEKAKKSTSEIVKKRNTGKTVSIDDTELPTIRKSSMSVKETANRRKSSTPIRGHKKQQMLSKKVMDNHANTGSIRDISSIRGSNTDDDEHEFQTSADDESVYSSQVRFNTDPKHIIQSFEVNDVSVTDQPKKLSKKRY